MNISNYHQARPSKAKELKCKLGYSILSFCSCSLIRLSHHSRFFVAELQHFLSGLNLLKLLKFCRNIRFYRTLADFLSWLTALGLGPSRSPSCWIDPCSLMTIPYWLRYARAPINSSFSRDVRKTKMLESFRRTPTWRLHTKDYNFQWYCLLNNWSCEYRISPKLRHLEYLLLFYNISIPWLNLLNGKRFYLLLAW